MEVTSLVSRSAKETHLIGLRLGGQLDSGLLLLHGPLGVGKSVFAAGIAEGLGITGPITSPTFTIVNEYRADSAHHEMPFYHIDLYRIEDQGEFEMLGLDDVLYGRGICVVEWPERAGDALPDAAISIQLEIAANGDRRITYPTTLLPV